MRDVLALKGIGDQGQAERALSYVEPLSKKVIELLTVMERKVSEAQNANIVVLRADDRQFGLVVDEINDTEEIVVKPLSKQLNQDPPENSCRPAVDALFRSVAQVYGPRALGVVMTGMGSDGARGAAHIREAGGEVLVQDEASSVVWGMPGAVVGAGAADKICPLAEISQEVVRRITASRVQVSGTPATLKI